MPPEPRQIGVARNHDELVDLLVARKNELQLSDQLVDEIGLFAPSYSNRILGPTREKTLSQRALDEFMRIFAVSIVLVVDEDKIERIRARWEQRLSRCAHPNQRISAKAREKVLRELSAKGNAARTLMLPGKHRSEIARKAAKKRWKKPNSRDASPGPSISKVEPRARARGNRPRQSAGSAEPSAQV